MTDSTTDFILGAIVGLFAWFFGGLDGLLQLLLALIVIDYISGVCVAWKNGTISSSIGFWGIVKKCVMLTFVGIAHLLDKHLLGDTSAIRSAVTLFYIATEGTSIIENADKLNVPFPQMLRERFLDMKDENDKPKNYKHEQEK